MNNMLMQKKIIAVLMATCLCALTQGRGQSLPTQPRPLVRLPQNGGTWTIQFKPRTPAAPTPKPGQARVAGPKTLQSISVVSTRDLRRERLQWSDGTSSELWKINGEWFFADQGQPAQSVNVIPGGHIYTDWKSFDNNQLQQLAKSGTGVLTAYYNTPALLYTATRAEEVISYSTSLDGILKAGKTSGPSSIKSPMGLYVNPETSYPIAYLDLNGDYVFSNVTEGLAENLVVPPDFARVVKLSIDAAYIPKPPNHP